MNSPFSRRALLSRASTGFGMAALAGLMQEEALANTPLVNRAKRFAPKARSVIFLYMSGGVSHVDSFDHKPMLTKFAGGSGKNAGLGLAANLFEIGNLVGGEIATGIPKILRQATVVQLGFEPVESHRHLPSFIQS